ncbi:Ger(x)C family spore germination protein [Paenibacillus sp. CAA11]|uniref:Ger(x)C family spore germination protein n=1 Tax=Paenibacillus sp. CAA11 TaxID=1532905 RepID=UPI00131EE062|nr:Ger(x)C family spore germination protein [Paenibacillus sp. CAA11]
MRLLKAACLSLAMGMSLSGCWNRTELNELGITSATGLDRKDKEWRVSYQMIVPSVMSSGSGGGSSGSSSQPAVHTFSTQAKTIQEANNYTNLENARRLYVSHNNALVIGGEAARQGISPIVDVYFRNTEQRETVLLFVTEGTAEEMLRMLIPPEKLPGASLAEIIRKENETASIYPSINMLEFGQRLNSDAKGAAIPVISIAGDDSTEGRESLESLDVNKSTSPPAKIKLTKLAIFQGDRIVDLLDPAESRGITWLIGKTKESVISIPFPDAEESEADSQLSSVRIRSTSIRIKPIKRDDHYVMQVKAKVNGVLLGTDVTEDLSKPRVIKQLQTQLEKRIAQEMETGMTAIRRLRVDVAGFADKVHRKYPRDWRKIKERWAEELAQIELDIHVDATIKRPGILQKSFRSLWQNS